MIALQRGPVSCTLEPGLGGSFRSLYVGNRAVLRPTASLRPDILGTACFPLVPFANRIGYGRLQYAGDAIDLPPDPAATPHAHHGFGWRNRWTVDQQDQSAVKMRYEHRPDAWPWKFEAIQNVELLDGGCALTMSVTNLDSTPMPCGLGFHPYFLRDTRSTIVTAANKVLLADKDDLPTETAAFRPGRHAIGDLQPFDNLLIDTSGKIGIETGGLSIELSAPDAAGYHVYAPTDAGYFCVEPVSHWPNSFQELDERKLVLPGSRMEFHVSLIVTGAT